MKNPICESDFLSLLKASKQTLLFEPPYRRNYPPLALAKMVSYRKKWGRGKSLYARAYSGQKVDLVCITSLFTYRSKEVIQSIQKLDEGFFALPKKVPIIVGGIYATLLTEDLLNRIKRKNVYIFRGYSKKLDHCVPDLDSFDWREKPRWFPFSFVFTSRGCLRKCPWCGVKTLEKDFWINPTWKKHILKDRPNVCLQDNNLSATPEKHFEDVFRFLIDNKKGVYIDGGLDVRLITKEKIKILKKVKFVGRGIRLAFDTMDCDGKIQKTVELMKKAGISENEMMIFVLYNFKDKPMEAQYRMLECVKLGVKPYPQRYCPLTETKSSNGYIGKYWTKRLSKAFRDYWSSDKLWHICSFEKYHQTKLLKKDWDAWNTP